MRMEQVSLLFQRLFDDFQTSMPKVLDEVTALSLKRRLCMRMISRMLAETQLHCAAEWRSELGTWIVSSPSNSLYFPLVLLRPMCLR